jgi:hypothetical protein
MRFERMREEDCVTPADGGAAPTAPCAGYSADSPSASSSSASRARRAGAVSCFARMSAAVVRLAHDADVQRRADVLRQLHVDGVVAKVLDVVLEQHVVPVELGAERLADLGRHVRRADGAEQLARRPGLRRDGERLRLQPVRDRACVAVPRVLQARLAHGPLLGRLDDARGGSGGEPARQQVVAREPRLHLLDVTDLRGAAAW